MTGLRARAAKGDQVTKTPCEPQPHEHTMQLTVIVPTFNEAPNVGELVRRIANAVTGLDAEILFVDDSTDATPDVVGRAAEASSLPIRLLHRPVPRGGLSGAVVTGLRSAHADVCIVMDGDLQHPPETLPLLLERHALSGADVVVASRYTSGGSALGLTDAVRIAVSRASTLLAKALFPVRLHGVSDPMTGFFLVDRRAADLDKLHPHGFKILLELLVRNNMHATEIPFQFADRFAGQSKASLRQGASFLVQLCLLRLRGAPHEALIGGLGTAVGLVITAQALARRVR